MKSYIIHIKNHSASKAQARDCLLSCAKKFDAELFAGVTPDTLGDYELKYSFIEMNPSRANDYFFQNQKKYKTKKSCFMNHVRLWHKCVERNEPIAVLEHDAICKRKWDNVEFDECLILNLNSAVYFNRNIKKNLEGKYTYKHHGTTDVREADYKFKYWKENIWKGGTLIPGTAAYAITPKGAQRLIDSVYKNGWDQSDFFINGNNVHLQYASPEYFKFNERNLKTSWGI